MNTKKDTTKLANLPTDTTLYIPIVAGSALYRVENDKMLALHRNAILKGDLITVAPVALNKLQSGKTYVVTDLKGNTFIGLVGRSADGIKVYPRNSAYPVVKLAVTDISVIEQVYKIQRDVMSDIDLEQLIKDEDRLNAGIAPRKDTDHA